MFDGSHLRRQLTYWFSLLSSIILAPFAIRNLLTDQILLFILSGGVSIFLLVIWMTIKYVGRIPTVLVILGSGVTSVSVVVVTIELGLTGILWSYPLPLLLFSLMSTRGALWIGIPTALSLMAIALLTFTEPLALRAVATITLTWGFSALFAITIDRQHRKLSDLALKDPLTELGNRRVFYDDLACALSSNKRNNTASTLIIFDVDHFKNLNDRHGHQYGDKILEQLADRVQNTLRGEDRLYRTGGEEFAVLLPGTGADGALNVANRIRNVVRTISETGTVTVSQGIAELAKFDDAETWVKHADQSMYQAKHAGRDCIRIATSASNSEQDPGSVRAAVGLRSPDPTAACGSTHKSRCAMRGAGDTS